MAIAKLILSSLIFVCISFGAKSASAQTPAGQTNASVKHVANANAKSWIPQQKMCTNAAKSDWLTKEEFLLLMKHRGYTVQTFRIVYESCYEVYGFDKNGRIVEVYFNPENARLNRQNNVSDK